MKNKLLSLVVVLAILGALSLSCCCCFSLFYLWGDPTAAARQGTVDAMRALTQDLKFPEHFREGRQVARTGEEFDVNEYLVVLDRLSMEPGYTLDYVYYQDGFGGFPCLYARPVDQPRYRTYSEYVNAVGEPTANEDRERFWYGYMDRVQTDGSEEGFFQLVVLRIMGGQFYLDWHANYNDFTIVCNRAGLGPTLQQGFGSPIALLLVPQLDVQLMARASGLGPSVEIGEDTVRVRVIGFTQWGGFIQRTYTISKDSPHRVLEQDSETLVPYDSGIMF